MPFVGNVLPLCKTLSVAKWTHGRLYGPLSRRRLRSAECVRARFDPDRQRPLSSGFIFNVGGMYATRWFVSAGGGDGIGRLCSLRVRPNGFGPIEGTHQSSGPERAG